MNAGSPHLIGLTGYAQTGKDTVAVCLARHGYKRLAFADALRDSLYELDPKVGVRFGDPIRLRRIVDATGWENAKKLSEVRRLLQSLGDVLKQVGGQDILVKVVLDQIATGGQHVITDVRFPDEVAAIRSRGGEIWQIKRPGVGPVNEHISETALIGLEADRIITNDGSLAEFGTAISVALIRNR